MTTSVGSIIREYYLFYIVEQHHNIIDRVTIGRNSQNNVVCIDGGQLIGRFDHATVELEYGIVTLNAVWQSNS